MKKKILFPNEKLSEAEQIRMEYDRLKALAEEKKLEEEKQEKEKTKRKRQEKEKLEEKTKISDKVFEL